MHSRIFEIVPIGYDKDGYEYEIPSWWEEENCDYYNEILDEEEIADSIKYFLSDEDVKDKVITFTKNNLKEHWIKFKESLDKVVSLATEDAFLKNDTETFHKLDWELYNVKESFNSQTGVWFMDKYGDMYTKMDMERAGGTYRIERVWDYHF